MDEQQSDNINPEIEQHQQETPNSKKGLVITIVIVSFLIVGGALAGYFFFVRESTVKTPTTSLGVPAPGFEDVDEMIVNDNELTNENKLCQVCPNILPVPDNFCNDGIIESPKQDKCGCFGPPRCITVTP